MSERRFSRSAAGFPQPANEFFATPPKAAAPLIPWLLVASLLCREGEKLSTLVTDRMAAFGACARSRSSNRGRNTISPTSDNANVNTCLLAARLNEASERIKIFG